MERLFPTLDSLMAHRETIKFACCLTDDPEKIFRLICSRIHNPGKQSSTSRIDALNGLVRPIAQELAQKYQLDQLHNEFVNYLSEPEPQDKFTRSRVYWYQSGKGQHRLRGFVGSWDVSVEPRNTILFSCPEGKPPSGSTQRCVLFTEDIYDAVHVLSPVRQHCQFILIDIFPNSLQGRKFSWLNIWASRWMQWICSNKPSVAK